ncbi:hypothetical protein C9F11_38190 [Streptomyces sp. YIM 121038]|uniref:DUF6907 domain-containing protein n=1 Tax=Streptomyces sp. YIM 121038 TaxID=2136401 RepID=UPI0011109795|nr:hypothetical protein [Streptomyces sp. YIM 121038]QCX81221.1 hypothetical protein C9F11_38190 [Streptomyces sp. YIM 121038]
MPAKVGRPEGPTATIYIECPTSWCDSGTHVAEPTAHPEDISHISGAEANEVSVSSFLKSKHVAAHMLTSTIQCDPGSHDPRLEAAHIVIEDDVDYAHLTPDMGEAFADDLVAFASRLRQQARTARQHNQTVAGDSGTDMDEALRRVRGGAA